MPYEFEFHDREDYILVSTGGEASTLEDVLGYADAIMTEMRDRGYSCILHDQRSFVASVGAYEAVELAKYLADADAQSYGMRAAIVSSEANYEISRIFETAFQNRSMELRVFLDFDRAERWLRTKESKSLSRVSSLEKI